MNIDDKREIEELASKCAELGGGKGVNGAYVVKELQPVLARLRRAEAGAFYYRNIAIGMVCSVKDMLSGTPDQLSMRDAIYRRCKEYAAADALAMSPAEQREQAAAEQVVVRLSEKIRGKGGLA